MAHHIGTLPGWLALLALLGGAYVYMRGGSGTAVKGLQDINKELERQIHARDATIVEKDLQIAELRAQKDIAVAIRPLLEWSQLHEQRAQERHVGLLKIMDLIAVRLGNEEA